jgi:hypothetical protein
MNRRQKKLEKKRAKRAKVKKKARVALARKPSADTLILGAASHAPFGPCYVSAHWDDPDEPELVTLVVTRRLPDERLVAGMALVDRTCLGIKDGYFDGPMSDEELADFIEEIGTPHGGMEEHEPLVAQSIAYHAIDYARKLGFEPQRDFPEKLFGPRPAELQKTAWAAEERPLYVMGLRDDVDWVLDQLDRAVGPENYDVVDPMDTEYEEEDVIEAEVVEKPPEAGPDGPMTQPEHGRRGKGETLGDVVEPAVPPEAWESLGQRRGK